MAKVAQVWNYEYGFENLDQICSRLYAAGWDAVGVKVLDGQWWHGEYTAGEGYVHNAEDMAAQRERVHGWGLKYHAWVNPRPSSRVDWDLQLQNLAAAAANCDTMTFDVEPYDQFWGAWPDTWMAPALLAALPQDQRYILQPDPRPGRLEEIRPEQWIQGGCSIIAGQHYWTDFNQDPSYQLQRAHELQGEFGIPCWPTLPGNMQREDLTDEVLEDLSHFQGFHLWRLGTPVTDDILQILGQVKSDYEEDDVDPDAQPPISDLEWYKSTLGYLSHDWMDLLKGETERAGGPRKTVLRNLLPKLQEVRDALDAAQ